MKKRHHWNPGSPGDVLEYLLRWLGSAALAWLIRSKKLIIVDVDVCCGVRGLFLFCGLRRDLLLLRGKGRAGVKM